jgi:hypothetical protein
MLDKMIKKSIGAIQKTFLLLGLHKEQTLPNLYISFSESLIKAHGSRESIKILKAIYQECCRYSCRLPYEVKTTKWLKRYKDGFPRKFKPFRPFLLGSDLQIRYALTILRVYEIADLAPVEDFSTITESSGGAEFFKRQETSFTNFLEKSRFARDFKRKFDNEVTKIVPNTNPEKSKLHFSFKRGVGGPTCLTAGVQTLAITDEYLEKLESIRHIFTQDEAWKDIFLANQEYSKDNQDIAKAKPETSKALGRISFIPAAGGKTRVIAIANYWVQDALKGLHKTLYKVLKTTTTDGTYDQKSQFERVRAYSSEGPVWSYDLTAATDRLPIDPQIAILNFLREDLGDLWGDILKEIKFLHKGQYYTYAVGQPMGLYSSWAMLATTHHFIIQYLAWLSKESYPFDKYAVLGDDVAIWSEDVAERYEQHMKGLEVVINRSKSYIPLSLTGPCVAEFAKRLSNKGVEFTALPPKVLIEGWKHYSFAPELILCLRNFNLLVEDLPLSRVVKGYGLNKPKSVDDLCCLFKIKECLGAPCGVTFDIPRAINTDFITRGSVYELRLDNLIKQASDLWSDLMDEDQTGLALEKRLSGEIPEYHYFKIIMSTRLSEILELEKRLMKLIPEEGGTIDHIDIAPLTEIEYLPHVDIETILKTIEDGPSKRNRYYRSKYLQLLSTQSQQNETSKGEEAEGDVDDW